jgi:hypothetical protein
MANLTADRVKETTTTTGTGTLTLAGAVAQFRSFASAFADGNVVQYAIVGQTGTEWEVGNGTIGASGTTLARTAVLASSNSNNAVNFSAGTKDVFATVTAAHLLAAVLGPASATDNGVAVYDGTTGKLVKNATLLFASGQLTLPAGSSPSAPGLIIGSTLTCGFFRDADTGANFIGFAASGTTSFRMGQAQFDFVGNGLLTWGNQVNTFSGSASDVGLKRKAAGVLQVTSGADGNVRALLGGGTAVASASALPVPTGRVFHVTGTTGITSITSTNFQAGTVITLIFDGILTVTDGSNLKLAGNFTTAADSTLTLVYDGSNWFETSRSAN